MCDLNEYALLGLPLEIALERIRAAGEPEPEIMVTGDPRQKNALADHSVSGSQRVVQAVPGRLTVSRFADGAPREPDPVTT